MEIVDNSIIQKIKIKYSFQDAIELAKELGGECISLPDEFKNSKSYLKWQCADGHEWIAKFRTIKYYNSWCTQCRNKTPIKQSFQDAIDIAEKLGGQCLSSPDEFKNSLSYLKWQCADGHEWISKLCHIRYNKIWCTRCRQNLKSSNKSEVVSTTKKDQLLNTKYSFQDAIVLAEELGGKCISSPHEFENSNSYLKWQCVNGHEWTTKFSTIKYYQSWCPQCRSFYLYEEMTRDILQKLFNLKFIKTRRILNGYEIDCYNEELHIAVEYNGIQHYKYDKFFHKSIEEFNHQVNKDQLKRELCIEKKILLVEIPYKCRTYTGIKDFLIHQFMETPFQYILNTDQNWDEFSKTIRSKTIDFKLNELKEIALNKNGKCLSASYGGSYEKLEFKCEVDDHTSFYTTPNDIKQGKWCPDCGKTKKKTDEQLQNLVIQLNGEYITSESREVNGRYRKFVTYINESGNTVSVYLENLQRSIKRRNKKK